MRTIYLPQAMGSDAAVTFSSGPGAPIFEPGPQTRIFRAPVRAIGVGTCDGVEVWGQVLDISLGGCRLKTDDPLTVGAELELRITIIGNDSRAVADVRGSVRSTSTDGGRPTYGIELVGADSEERRVLQWLYAQALR